MSGEEVPMIAPRPFETRFDPDGTVYLSGELDMATAASFSRDVAAGVDGQRPVLDLSDVTFVDSTGIRAILQLAQTKGQAVVLRNLRPNVRRVLTIAGVDETLGVQIADPDGDEFRVVRQGD
jgi:anti-sigma B factor antagonist